MAASPPIPATLRYRLAFIGLTAACYLGLIAWPDFMAALGAGHAGVWFLDMNTLLASNDAVRMGLDPYRPNPLDYLRDAHAYSDWWLQLRHLGLGRADRLWLGTLVDVLFFAAVFWRLRPAAFREALVLWLLVWSPPLILGFNRANPDLLVFALLVPVTHMLRTARPAARVAAAAAIVLAIGLKYYPVVACLVVFFTAGSRRELTLWLAAWAGLGVALFLNLRDDLARTGGLMAVASGFYTFGAAVLSKNLNGNPWVFLAGIALASAAFATGWLRPWLPRDDGRTADVADFILGAALIAAGFLVTISYTYRFVFVLLMVPWLLELTRGAGPGRTFGWTMLLASVALFWSDGLAALVGNSLIGTLSEAGLAAGLKAAIVTIHTAGWLWIAVLMLGLGSVVRTGADRWLPAVRLTDRG